MKICIANWVVRVSIILLLPILTSAQSETENPWKAWSVNVNGGVSLCYGDVQNYRFYKVFENNSEWRFGGGIMLQKQFNPYFTLRGQLFYGELSGTKRKSNIWFEGDLFEMSLSGKLDFINLIFGPKVRKFSFYGMLGIGIVQWRTSLMDFTTNDQIGGNGNMGGGINGRTLETVIPFGLGVDYNINERWVLNLEGSLRPVNSDVLDGKSGGFQFDFYSYNFIGVTYKFVKRKEKPLTLPAEEIAVVAEPEIEPEIQEAEPEVEVVVEEIPPVKTLEEKLLDKEAETGLYESPWPGVNFTVQIAASKTISDPQVIADKYKISAKINQNSGGGWNRFSMGNFIKYWKAKEYRNILQTRNGIQDAFVVAYRDGERIMLSDLITVDEAEQRAQPKRPSINRAFSVQVLATSNGNIPPAVIKEMYEIDLDVFKEYNSSDNTYQYSVGNFGTYNDAAKVRNKLKAKGISGAFVVGYKDGSRVSDLKSILD